ncbi:MAG TPA: hypothetical protein VKK79_12330 [Candidatus Lokiarchaeia archaeon]|nr:hypothetical protein [Candidatus Lokiarchaeia archaeon]
MARPAAIIGGILAIIGSLGSFFIAILGWYTVEFSGIINVTASVTAFGGLVADPSSWAGNASPYSNQILEILPGILALIGGILCLIPKKGATILGGLLILVAIILFGYNLVSATNQFLGYFGTSLSNLSSSNIGQLLWNTQGGLLESIFNHIGYGLILTLIGGILGLIGSAGKD